MESTEEVLQEYSLSGSAEVRIDHNGCVSFGNQFYPNIIWKDSYKKVSKDLKSLVKKLQKGNFKYPNERDMTEKTVEFFRFRKENIKIGYFHQIVRDIASVQPAELSIVYVPKDNERQSFSSQFFKDSQTITLMKMIQKKLTSMGTKISYSDNIKEEVLDRLNFNAVAKI